MVDAVPGGEIGVRGQSRAEIGVLGFSPFGTGVAANSREGVRLEARSPAGWAAHFDGRISATRFIEIAEMPTPGRPPANRARLFVRGNGANHTQLCVMFPKGVVRVPCDGVSRQ